MTQSEHHQGANARIWVRPHAGARFTRLSHVDLDQTVDEFKTLIINTGKFTFIRSDVCCMTLFRLDRGVHTLMEEDQLLSAFIRGNDEFIEVKHTQAAANPRGAVAEFVLNDAGDMVLRPLPLPLPPQPELTLKEFAAAWAFQNRVKEKASLILSLVVAAVIARILYM